MPHTLTEAAKSESTALLDKRTGFYFYELAETIHSKEAGVFEA